MRNWPTSARCSIGTSVLYAHLQRLRGIGSNASYRPEVVAGGRAIELREHFASTLVSVQLSAICLGKISTADAASGQYMADPTARAPLVEAARVEDERLVVNWRQPPGGASPASVMGGVTPPSVSSDRTRSSAGEGSTSTSSCIPKAALEHALASSRPQLDPPCVLFPSKPGGRSRVRTFDYSTLVTGTHHAAKGNASGDGHAHTSLPMDGTPSQDEAQERALLAMLQAVNRDGLAVVSGCPTSAEDSVLHLAGRIGPPMHTLYGRTWRVEATAQAANIAYTSHALHLHTDLIYYESPPGLQLLCCRAFDEGVRGGESTFLDGFTAAKLLRVRHPRHFLALLNLPATFQKVHYERARPAHLLYRRPHLSVIPPAYVSPGSPAYIDALLQAPINAVFWAPPFEGPCTLPLPLQEQYWSAYHAFADTLLDMEEGRVSAEEAQLIGSTAEGHKGAGGKWSGLLEFRLKPGEAVVFNNRRLLHGRRAFHLPQPSRTGAGTSHLAEGGSGQRLLQGCYISTDDYTSRLQHLADTLGQGGADRAVVYRVGDQNWR